MILQIDKLFKIGFILFFSKCFSQNELTYVQENSKMFTNKYILNIDSKTFEHYYSTDDGQLWVGRGEYSLRFNKIIFNFKDAKPNTSPFNIEYLHDESIDINKFCLRNLSIKRKRYISNFIQIKVNDEFIVPNNEGDIFIDKNSSVKIVFFKDNVKVLSLFIKDLKQFNLLEIDGFTFEKPIHYESNFTRVLKFKNDYLISEDFYNTSKKNKVRFIKQSQLQ